MKIFTLKKILICVHQYESSNYKIRIIPTLAKDGVAWEKLGGGDLQGAKGLGSGLGRSTNKSLEFNAILSVFTSFLSIFVIFNNFLSFIII